MSAPSSILASAVSQFNVSPPPTLRDILTAYKERGDGDKAMLLALLQAKTAEDERIASMASLHRSVLDAYYRYPNSSPSSSGGTSYRHEPPYSPQLLQAHSSHHHHPSYSHSHSHPHSYPVSHPPPSPPHSYSSSSYSYARKRSRVDYHNEDDISPSRSRSRSPLPRRDGAHAHHHTQARPMYSSKYSPRTQASMTIDSLLSSSSESTASVGTQRGVDDDADVLEDEEDVSSLERRGRRRRSPKLNDTRSRSSSRNTKLRSGGKGGDVRHTHGELETAVPVR